MYPKLIAIDCDNTLLDEYGNICDINKRIISRLSKTGVHIVISTGRNDILAKDYMEELGLDSPLISCNGAMISNVFTGEVFFMQSVDNAAAKTVFDYCKNNGILFKMLTDKACYTNDKEAMRLGLSQIVKKYTRKLKYGIPYNFAEDMDALVSEKNILKIVIINDDPLIRAAILRDLSSLNAVSVYTSGFNCIDIMSENVSKGTALEKYAQKLGIDRRDIIAFGDGENDISMIEYAGIGAAMLNGDEKLKKAADIVTKYDNTNGGVGLTLAEIFGLEV